VQQREPAEPEHEHDLLGRVGDRGERVGAEHRQREPLRQQRLVEAVAAQRLADDGAGEAAVAEAMPPASSARTAAQGAVLTEP
jgi:hypothetical protein